jgi:hypothetical protein
MPDEQDLSNDERKLEAALAHLKPREPELDAIAIAYEAGRRSAAWRLTTWRAVAAMLLIALTLSALLRPAPRTIQTIVSAPPQPQTSFTHVSQSPQQSPSYNAGPLTYLRLRQNVIQYGSVALPASPPAASDNSVIHVGSWRTQSGDNL